MRYSFVIPRYRSEYMVSLVVDELIDALLGYG